jgi:uncharacterized coiled-coil DUF342 family protein
MNEKSGELMEAPAAAENLAERVVDLERSVKRAVEAIGLLRKERDALLSRLEVMEAERRELNALKQERREVLAQVDSILKELDRLDL